MPIYEYRCGACGQEHEVLQKVSEPPLTECPACGKPKLQKLVSAAGFQLKGSGWYATDFKGGGKKPEEKKPPAKAEGKAEAKAESKAETKSDSKPASTTATTD
ncbi:MAG TPA: zinc ribbon domain-containing protein [Burkholderiales bacterium]|nr:zinc ribbon domain-containing protein [Burkholderiales bacterium]